MLLLSYIHPTLPAQSSSWGWIDQELWLQEQLEACTSQAQQNHTIAEIKFF